MPVTDKAQPSPRVSVVIPAFNSSKTIRPALESCLAQTALPFEIIVVDDASSDGAADVVESFLRDHASPSGVRYRIIRHGKNEGPSKSRNDGWDCAEGDWIAFLDADDMWHPSKLKISLDVASMNAGVAMVAHAFEVTQSQAGGMPWPSVPHAEPRPRRLSFLPLLLYNTIATPTVLLSRDLPERFSEDMRYCEDHELWLRLAVAHTVLYYDLPLTRLGRPLLTPGGASSAMWKMRLAEMRMYSRVARTRRMLFPLVPILIVWSLMKHVVVCLWVWGRGSVPHVAWKH